MTVLRGQRKDETPGVAVISASRPHGECQSGSDASVQTVIAKYLVFGNRSDAVKMTGVQSPEARIVLSMAG